MAKTSYYTIDGEIIADRMAAVGRRDFLPDGLGSVVATCSAAGIQNVYAYKPYGAQLSRAGPGIDANFGWIGLKGYRITGRTWAETYVRARTYSSASARWATRDPLWPLDSSYGYVSGNPVSISDPTGLATCEQVRDQCLAEADDKQNTCFEGVWKRFGAEYNACKGLPQPERDECKRGALGKLRASLNECRLQNDFRYRLCGEAYDACAQARSDNLHAILWGFAAVATYAVYQVAKDTGAILSGQPEFVFAP